MIIWLLYNIIIIYIVTIYTVFTIYIVYTIRMVYIIRTVYIICIVFTIYIVCALFIYRVAFYCNLFIGVAFYSILPQFAVRCCDFVAKRAFCANCYRPYPPAANRNNEPQKKFPDVIFLFYFYI